MLGHAIPWRAAPRLPLQAMRVGLRIRPTAFGNAIGGAFVGKMQEPSGGVAALQQAERDVEIPYLNEQYNSDQASMSNSSGYMGDVVSLDGAGILRPPGVGYTQAELLAEQDAGMDDSAKVYTQRSHVVQAGDSISKILGTSDPTSIGAFMRRNDLKNSTIYPGRELVIPDGFADGDGARGQAALNADNASRVTKANTEKQAGILGFMGAADAYYAGQAQWAAVARATTPFQISGSLNLVPENRYTPANSYLGDAYREAYGGMVNTSNSWREQAGYGVRAVLLAVPGLLNDLSAAIWNGPNDIYVGGQEMMFGHATGNLDRFSGGLMRSSVGVLSVASTGSMWQQGLAANAAVTEYSIYNQAASASYRGGANNTVTAYRVEGIPNQRMLISETGEVSLVPGKDQMVWVNFGQEGRATQYLQTKIEKGLPGAELKSFEVDSTFLGRVRADAVPEQFARQNPGRPIISRDPYPDQFGIPSNYFDDFLNSIKQGTGKSGR